MSLSLVSVIPGRSSHLFSLVFRSCRRHLESPGLFPCGSPPPRAGRVSAPGDGLQLSAFWREAAVWRLPTREHAGPLVPRVQVFSTARVHPAGANSCTRGLAPVCRQTCERNLYVCPEAACEMGMSSVCQTTVPGGGSGSHLYPKRASPLSPSPPGPALGTVHLLRFAGGWGVGPSLCSPPAPGAEGVALASRPFVFL